MRIISGFFVYKAYITYKTHFTQEGVDISMYGYKLFNISYESFLNTKGKYYYDKIAKKIQKESDLISLFIAVFVDSPDIWIGDIWDNINQYIELKNERESRIDNMSYLFKKDCIYLIDSGMSFDDTTGEFILSSFMKSDIELETFIILKKIFRFELDNVTAYDYFYRGKYEKYEFLLNINIEKYKIILKEVVMNSGD